MIERYIYAWTVQKSVGVGEVDIRCGSISRDSPIRTNDEYIEVLKYICEDIGLVGGVFMSLALVSGNDSRQDGKTIEQHRAEFEGWCDKEGYDTYRHLDEDHEPVGDYADIQTYRLWQAWQAARGLQP